MKNIRYHRTLFVLLTMFGFFSCVDDYTEANPPSLLDAPTIQVISSTGSGQVLEVTPNDRFSNAAEVFILYGSTVTFTVSVIDAPGKIASVSVTPSIPEFGTVALNEASVTAIKGSEKGDFTFTYTPSDVLPDKSDRSLNLVITVSDSQVDEKGNLLPKVTTLSISTNIVGVGGCLEEPLQEGYYLVTSASGNIDGGTPYTLSGLESAMKSKLSVLITKARPGAYTINEVTAGIWPAFYSPRARPVVTINLCDNVISGKETIVGGIRKFTVDGTLNTDGTIAITWSYVRTVGPTPANPAKGTYILSKI